MFINTSNCHKMHSANAYTLQQLIASGTGTASRYLGEYLETVTQGMGKALAEYAVHADAGNGSIKIEDFPILYHCETIKEVLETYEAFHEMMMNPTLRALLYSNTFINSFPTGYRAVYRYTKITTNSTEASPRGSQTLNLIWHVPKTFGIVTDYLRFIKYTKEYAPNYRIATFQIETPVGSDEMVGVPGSSYWYVNTIVGWHGSAEDWYKNWEFKPGESRKVFITETYKNGTEGVTYSQWPGMYVFWREIALASDIPSLGDQFEGAYFMKSDIEG